MTPARTTYSNEHEIPATHEEAMSTIFAGSGISVMSYEEAIAIYLRKRGILRGTFETLADPIPEDWSPPVPRPKITHEGLAKIVSQLDHLAGPDHSACVAMEGAKIIRALIADPDLGRQLQSLPPADPPKMITVQGKTREIQQPDMTDRQVADRARMLMRTDLDHEMVCTLIRDRIYWLVDEVERLKHRIGEMALEKIDLRERAEKAEKWAVGLAEALAWFQWAKSWADAEAWDGTDEMRARFDSVMSNSERVLQRPDQNKLAQMGQDYLKGEK